MTKRGKLLGSPQNVLKHSRFRKKCKKVLKSLRKTKNVFRLSSPVCHGPPAIGLVVYPVPLSPLAPGAMPFFGKGGGMGPIAPSAPLAVIAGVNFVVRFIIFTGLSEQI